MTSKVWQRCCKSSVGGFTLTEVLVVVLVIAVLTAIAYPFYTKAIIKSRAVEAVNLLEIVRAKQIERYTRTRGYYTEFKSMGQLTGNKATEINGSTILIKDYKVTMNALQECLIAQYNKGGGRVNFALSVSYNKEGLGCTGDICENFGNVIGKAEEICAIE